MSGPPPVSAVAVYVSALHTLIQNNVQISGIIRQLSLTGSVRVSFVLYPSGGLAKNLRVISGGANPLIRKAALDTVARLRYPPFPESFGHAPRSFQVVVKIGAGS